jgi:D-inositol-3-phosphate glycosyltransferase
VTVWCTSIGCELPGARRVVTTLTAAGRRIPHRALGGDRAYRYHDLRVALALRRRAGEVDVVHTWPRASLLTARAAARAGAKTVRQAPNTHTAYAYEVVREESARLGFAPPPGHSHAYDERRLRHELAEYDAADVVLCQSEFARATFIERGVPARKVAIHQNGADMARFAAERRGPRPVDRPLTALFAGRCEPRKGLHYALEAWIASGVGDRGGRFVICGEFVPGYREALAPLLHHPSIEHRGFVADLSGLMRESDVLVLPSVEEGSALVTYEAQSAGAVLLVSDATGARCEHMVTGLVHSARDTAALAGHLRLLERDPALLERLRSATVARLDELTWRRAAQVQARVYAAAVAGEIGKAG